MNTNVNADDLVMRRLPAAAGKTRVGLAMNR